MVLAYVRRLVDPDDWEAFYRVILEQQPVGEVAVAMQSRELAVRAAIHRVNQRLNQELQKCDDRF
jgi:DNA-directed RNA polymerase specialized sigma24 family protein